MTQSIRCLACELRQFPAKLCRRCHKALCGPTVERVADLEPPALPLPPFAFPDPLPTAEEWEMLLIAEALRRTGGYCVPAAKMLGMGKTTLFRKKRLLTAKDRVQS